MHFYNVKDILEVKEYSIPIMNNVVVDSKNVGDFYLYSTTSTEEYLSFLNGFEGKEFTIIDISIVISGETMNYIVTYIDEERIINL